MINNNIEFEEDAYKIGFSAERTITDQSVVVDIFKMLKTDNLKWSFIRGFFDISGSIDVENECCFFISHFYKLFKVISEYANIPSNIDDKSLNYYDTNAIDFLGEVYRNCSLKPKTEKHTMYLNLLNGKPVKKLPTCVVVRTTEDAVLPSKTRISDVGYDLSVIKKVKDLNKRVGLYDTGIKLRVSKGYYTEVVPRSSLSKSGYMLANSVGIIDRSYNGNIYVALAKIDEDAPEITFPFRCCQLIFRRQEHVEIIEATKEKLQLTSRDQGGFGSTG